MIKKIARTVLLVILILQSVILPITQATSSIQAADKTKTAVSNDYDKAGTLEDPIVDNWEPSKLNQNITDPKNMLGSSKSRVIDAVNKAITQVGENVFVIFIPRFDGAINGEDWCKKTAEKSGLASNAVIFAVAYDRGEQTIYIPHDSEKLDPSKISTISEIAQKFLSQGDWGKSAEAVINAIIAITDKPIYIPFITYGIIALMVLLFIGGIIYKLLHHTENKNKRRKKNPIRNILGLEKKELDKLSQKKEFDPTQTSTTLTAIKIDETSSSIPKITQDMIKKPRRRKE